LRRGQQGTCVDAEAAKMETRPQPLYTMATLLADLTRVAKYIRDERLRQLLLEKDRGKQGEHGGIGTPATRDSIIATLFERAYLVEQGKSIVPTPTGEELYDALPDAARFPDMTALWHEQQQAIKAGARDAESFVRELMDYIAREVDSVKANGIGIQVQAPPCPQCGKPLRRIRKKDKAEFFWGCTGYAEGCKFACDDKAGKPAARSGPKASTRYKCRACGGGLCRRASTKKKGAFWWGCSSYPACTHTCADLKGRPADSQGNSTLARKPA